MLAKLIKFKPAVTGCRQLSTTSQLGFKFKLTEEMSREYEKAKEAVKEEVKEPALHTKQSPLIMGRVSSERYKSVIKVAIPKHRMNDMLLLYRRENDDIEAYDENNICQPGDWILLRRDETIVDKNIKHKVERVVHSYGNYVCPLTGRRSFGLYYDDDMERLERIKVEL